MRSIPIIVLTAKDLTGSDRIHLVGNVKKILHNPLDQAIFSLFAMTSTSTPGDLLPRSQMVQALTALQVLVSIFLTGLLGFVAGNRIRR